jgi:F-type H+-transporting ATPase subunit b
MELLKLLTTNEIVAQVINFLILFFLLRIFLWKRILGILDERREKIAQDFKTIEGTKKSVEELKNDYEKKMGSIEEMAKTKMHEAVLEGGKIVSEIKKEAYRDAEKIIQSARADIRYEITKAKNELKDKVVDLTIQATESVIREKLTVESDKKIVKEFLDQMEELS